MTWPQRDTEAVIAQPAVPEEWCVWVSFTFFQKVQENKVNRAEQALDQDHNKIDK